jgi:hypothetical protein
MGAYRLGKGGGPFVEIAAMGATGLMMGLLSGKSITEPGKKFQAFLCTGDPGPNFTENKAVETAAKTGELSVVTFSTVEAGRKNEASLEWKEVKETETYKWIVLQDNGQIPGEYAIAVELTTPVAVVKGDTFIINKEKLIIKPKMT